ncbi:hypothetical protein LNKW23_15640 [Paralimibaculum aggregatum]|uniref:Uncharacterized protein n=1 Tax=Paralimibaculum aggregatum TaxID=3036245 RepID=A0ABQ6LGB2_9RHOB|nr:hypothetical protein [Limibaculum sp. NKW23]GMG82351.1 hypothetical protein LNKW23_15640 [Limibaculum sp. NKW23]
MLTLTECIEMCDLTREEVDAIAEHEHLPEVAAAALADYLMHLPDGPHQVRDMIRDDVRAALARGDHGHAAELVAALRHFVGEHPELRGMA